MKKYVFSLVACICMMVLSFPVVLCVAQEMPPLKTDTDDQKLIAEMEKQILVLMEKAEIPGLSIAIIKDSKIIWAEGFGIKNTKTGELVTKDTIFEAASLTKPFFAYMAMQMVESGELDLDKPLHEYLPREDLVKKYIRHPWDFEGFNREWFQRITARLVLSHSSGLPHGEPRRPLPILFEPGSRYKYSADGYQYLQQVIEHLKGEPLKDLMVKAALEPLGMKHSSMVWQKNYETQAAAATDLGGIEVAKKRLVITIGLDTIRHNHNCTAVIMAAGDAKSTIVKQAVTSDINIDTPASVLHDLPNDDLHLVFSIQIDEYRGALIEGNQALLNQGGELESATHLLDDLFFSKLIEHTVQPPLCVRISHISWTARSTWSLIT